MNAHIFVHKSYFSSVEILKRIFSSNFVSKVLCYLTNTVLFENNLFLRRNTGNIILKIEKYVLKVLLSAKYCQRTAKIVEPFIAAAKSYSAV